MMKYRFNLFEILANIILTFHFSYVLRNLISQLLVKDPTRRPDIKHVLAHPFLTGDINFVVVNFFFSKLFRFFCLFYTILFYLPLFLLPSFSFQRHLFPLSLTLPLILSLTLPSSFCLSLSLPPFVCLSLSLSFIYLLTFLPSLSCLSHRQDSHTHGRRVR